jgi:CRISPR-associated endonuclease/helicase Cas3
MTGLLSFWGKARSCEDDAVRWHPCLYHCLDVAATGAALLRARPTLLRQVAKDLAWHEQDARAALLFLLALHDIGKFSRTFQALVPEFWPADALGPLETEPPHNPRHDAAGAYLLDKLLPALAGSPFAAWLWREVNVLLPPPSPAIMAARSSRLSWRRSRSLARAAWLRRTMRSR